MNLQELLAKKAKIEAAVNNPNTAPAQKIVLEKALKSVNDQIAALQPANGQADKNGQTDKKKVDRPVSVSEKKAQKKTESKTKPARKTYDWQVVSHRELKKNWKQYLAELITLSDAETGKLLDEIRGQISIAYKTKNTDALKLLQAREALVTEARGMKLDAENKASQSAKKAKPAAKAAVKPTAAKSAGSANDLVAECKEAISTQRKDAKEQKLTGWKEQRLAQVAEKVKSKEITEKEAEEKRDEIKQASYSKAFANKKSITEQFSEKLLGSLKLMLNANTTQIAKTSQVAAGKKVENLRKSNAQMIDAFVKIALPAIHKHWLGEKSDRYIDQFKSKAQELSEEAIVRLSNRLEHRAAA